jgi:hypothetical protein
MENTQGHSEVARLLRQIGEEYAAAQRGLSAFAYGSTQHAFITQRMENMGVLHNRLKVLVGDVPALEMIIEQLDTASDVPALPMIIEQNVVPDTNSSSVQ